MTWASKRTAGAVLCFVKTMGLEVTRSGPAGLVAEVAHLLPHRASIGICDLVVVEIVCAQSVCLCLLLIFVKVVVLNVRCDAKAFQIQIVLFAAITSVGRYALGCLSE